MDWVLVLGLAAAGVSSFAGLPQLIKSIKTKSTKDLSLGMFSVLVTGNILWLTYGFAIKNVPLSLANAVSLFIAIWIIILKLKHK